MFLKILPYAKFWGMVALSTCALIYLFLLGERVFSPERRK
jgi:hypothetical protein